MKIATPKGTRDFLPHVLRKRKYIFGQIEQVFQLFGFQPIETPAMEYLSTLSGKYGDEGERLIFKVLSRGEKLQKALAEGEENTLAEEALRYDLTVPFARFVVQHKHEIALPFKRYQIQPVWRADRPQRGRYREFYQCDADVVGTSSLRCEIDFVQMFDLVFTGLQLPVEIRINNRKILVGMAAYLGHPDKLLPLTVAIDKLDKQSLDEVAQELRAAGFDESALKKLENLLTQVSNADSNNAMIALLDSCLAANTEAQKGLAELRYILQGAERFGLQSAVLKLDPSLARGLNYYTGAIFEVRPVGDYQVGSICGGGRYDNLTGIFGLKDVSGVGISFGADRIYDLMERLSLFPNSLHAASEVLFVNFGEKEADHCSAIACRLRADGFTCEVYPDAVKLKKQLKYANDCEVPFVAMAGENEIQAERIILKNMRTGAQNSISVEELPAKLREL